MVNIRLIVYIRVDNKTGKWLFLVSVPLIRP